MIRSDEMHQSVRNVASTSKTATRGVVARSLPQMARATTVQCAAGLKQKNGSAARDKEFDEDIEQFCGEFGKRGSQGECFSASDVDDWHSKYLSIIQDAFGSDTDGDTHLHLAIFFGLGDIAECLIELAPDCRYLNIANNMRQTPLHIATLIGQACLVRRLLLTGADCNVRDCNGNTALHYACAKADRACVQALTEPVSVSESVEQFGAHADNTTLSQLNIKLTAHLDEWNYEGMTCLHLAVLSGDIEIVCQLVCHGASTEVPDGRAGRSALQLSIETGRFSIARILLLSCGARADSCDYSGRSSLKLASAAGCHELSWLMIEQLSSNGLSSCSGEGVHGSRGAEADCCSETSDSSDCEFDSDSDSCKSGETHFYDSIDDRSISRLEPFAPI